jgi:glutathione S-transferase
MYESLVCNEFVNDLTGGKLLPADPSAAAGARLLIDQFTQKFGAAFGGLLFSEDGSEKANEAAQKVDEALAFLELNTAAPPADGSVPPPPAGPLFFLGSNGGAFTLVDAALYPFIARLNKVMPRLAPQSAGKFADLAGAGYPRVAAWLSGLAARPEVKRTEIAPAGSAGFWEALEETYVEYRARQRAAAAAK